jgi:uncharacterized protein
MSSRRTAGLIVFSAISLFGSWSVAATIRALGIDVVQPRFGTQLLGLSLYYLATMGWQPLLAAWIVRRYVDRDPLDLAIRPPGPRFNVIAVLAACALAVAAGLLGFALAGKGSLNGDADRQPVASMGLALSALVGLLLVWLQAVSEEVGWRGYVLPASMHRFGRWRGLVVHAVMWAVWYAPVVFFATLARADGVASLLRCGSFALSCALLGVLLGWLRLASKSVAPPVTANVTLTLVAGMPYVLHGIDTGLRSAIYRPIGWLVFATALCGLLLSRWRRVVRLPDAELPSRELALRYVLAAFGRGRDRTLN